MVALRSSFSSGGQAAKHESRRVAVVLNANARQVDAETLRLVQAVVPHPDLFVSKTLADGARIADEIVRRGYDAVLWGGGDGTFAAGVAALAAAAARRGAPLPEMGVLRLGTGNAIAEAVGAGPATLAGMAGEVGRARRQPARRNLQMLEIGGRPTLFAGFGLDAQIQQDYRRTLEHLERLGLKERVTSPGWRYFLAVAGHTFPRFVTEGRAELTAINRGAPARRVGIDGRTQGPPLPAGTVLWRGRATIASASCIPYYGLGLRMFPHAEGLSGQFALRLSDASAAEAICHLPAIFQGRYQSPRIHDFVADKVELIASEPMPFQTGGDLVGMLDRVTISLWERPVAVV